MGVDTSITIRLYDTKESYSDITVSEQDNSLGSLFYSGDISYTSISFDKSKELTEDEARLIELYEDEENEMLMKSAVVDAVELVGIFDKIQRKILYARTASALNKDMDEIDMNDNISPEEKQSRKRSVIGDYMHFQESFGIAAGILRAASELGKSVQIIAEFY